MISTDSLRSNSINAVKWSAIQGWGGQLIGFALFAILARLLSPTDSGLVAMAATFIAIANVLTTDGISTAVIQRETLEPGLCDTVFWCNTFVGLLIFILGLLAAPLVARFYGEPELTNILRVLCITILLRSSTTVHLALLRRELNFKKLAFRNFIALCSSGIVGVSMAFLGYGVWSLVTQQLIHSLILSLTLWRRSTWKPTFRFVPSQLRELLIFGVKIISANIAMLVNKQSDAVIVGYFLGPTTLGYYTIAYRLLEILSTLISGVTSSVTLPVFSALQSDLKRLSNAFLTAVKFNTLVSYPIYIGLAVLAPMLLPTLLDSKWQSSVIIVQILALGGVLSSTIYFHGGLLIALGKPNWRLATASFSACLKITLVLTAVHYGIVAVAMANVLTTAIVAPLSIWLVRHLLQFDWQIYLQSIFRPALNSVAMSIFVFLTMYYLSEFTTNPTNLATSFLTGVITYCLASTIFNYRTFLDLLSILKNIMLRKS